MGKVNQIPIDKTTYWQIKKNGMVIKDGFNNERDAYDWASKYLKYPYTVVKPSWSLYRYI